MKKTFFCSMLLGLQICPLLMAAPITPTQITHSLVEAAQSTQKAKIWNLSVDEYTHYQWLMKNTPSQLWYKKLDPAEVLGMNASNEKQRLKYALLEAKLAIQRVDNELAYQRDFTAAIKRLLPNVKPIEWRHGQTHHAPLTTYLSAIHQLRADQQTLSQTGNVLQAGDQLLLFMKLNHPDSNSVTDHLIGLIKQSPNTTLNIFVNGEVSDKAIRKWVTQNKTLLQLVRAGSVTLNHDKGRFNKTFKDKTPLPAVLLDRNNHFHLIPLSAIE